MLLDTLAKTELKVGWRDQQTLLSEAGLVPQRVIFRFWPFGKFR